MLREILPHLTVVNMILVAGIIWLSGVFLWLIRKFVGSYEKNTEVSTKLQGTMEAVDRKLDTAADRDVEIVKTLAAIHATQNAKPAEIRVLSGGEKK